MADQTLVRCSRYRPRDAVMASTVGDELILLDLDSGIYYSLNAIGVPIWRQLAEGSSRDQILDALLATYDVAPAAAEADLNVFIDRLLQWGLVTAA